MDRKLATVAFRVRTPILYADNTNKYKKIDGNNNNLCMCLCTWKQGAKINTF